MAGRDVGRLLWIGDVQLHDDWNYLWKIFCQPFPRPIAFTRDKFNPRVGDSLRDNDSFFIFTWAANRLGKIFTRGLLVNSDNANRFGVPRAPIDFSFKRIF